MGNGIDIHPLEAGRPMWLAGLHWPRETVGAAGHSDGDAAAHAICTALLSAAKLGDLGTNFGTDEPEMAGASGVTLVAEAAKRVRNAGYEIGNVTVQVVCNRPRFALRRQEAEKVLSEACGADVSVSAATSDGLGFTGRDEGIVAMATALIYGSASGSNFGPTF
ncbi:2-C-methyl-D-erythritol 2,4-cyclodiphosphate synthase [Kribbella sandramycini]|uniref:2-C-methyl-D-erythritol 2,4-cyclodiphosphate synthase n=1 Tax=Kribbella sandramycini TaxID=60450 RepID=A0A7Y4P284_9ACTN|nr:2-C-methyl-D-erythritol 2,4-cyclodiphosphate synthase [Kribbella sandramycini]